jgi:hypothetical protein
MLTGNRERLARIAAGHKKRAADLRAEVKRYDRLAFDDKTVAQRQATREKLARAHTAIAISLVRYSLNSIME